MGELLDAINQERAKLPRTTAVDEKLREFLGDAGWKDLMKACKDVGIPTATIHRVIKQKGFKVSYSALRRIRSMAQES